MSVDAWTNCPKCYTAQRDATQEVEKLYGKIPLEDWTKRLNNAQADNPVTRDTLREDYEIYCEGYYLYINYRCSCESCGFKFNYTKRVEIPHG